MKNQGKPQFVQKNLFFTGALKTALESDTKKIAPTIYQYLAEGIQTSLRQPLGDSNLRVSVTRETSRLHASLLISKELEVKLKSVAYVQKISVTDFLHRLVLEGVLKFKDLDSKTQNKLLESAYHLTLVIQPDAETVRLLSDMAIKLGVEVALLAEVFVKQGLARCAAQLSMTNLPEGD